MPDIYIFGGALIAALPVLILAILFSRPKFYVKKPQFDLEAGASHPIPCLESARVDTDQGKRYLILQNIQKGNYASLQVVYFNRKGKPCAAYTVDFTDSVVKVPVPKKAVGCAFYPFEKKVGFNHSIWKSIVLMIVTPLMTVLGSVYGTYCALVIYANYGYAHLFYWPGPTAFPIMIGLGIAAFLIAFFGFFIPSLHVRKKGM